MMAGNIPPGPGRDCAHELLANLSPSPSPVFGLLWLLLYIAVVRSLTVFSRPWYSADASCPSQPLPSHKGPQSKSSAISALKVVKRWSMCKTHWSHWSTALTVIVMQCQVFLRLTFNCLSQTCYTREWQCIKQNFWGLESISRERIYVKQELFSFTVRPLNTSRSVFQSSRLLARQ